MSESNDQQPGERLIAEVRAVSERGPDGEYLVPLGCNVRISMRLKEAATSKVVKGWFELSTRSFSIDAEASSITWAKVGVKLVDLDMVAMPEPGEFSQEDLQANNSKETK